MKNLKQKITLYLMMGLLLAPAIVFANTGETSTTLTNPIGVGTFCGLIQKILNAIIGFGVPVAFLFLVYSGFLFIVARGNETKLEHAKRNFFYVIVGIGLFLGAWTLGQIIATTLNELQAGSNNPSVQSCN